MHAIEVFALSPSMLIDCKGLFVTYEIFGHYGNPAVLLAALLTVAPCTGRAQTPTCNPNATRTTPVSRFSAINGGAEVKDSVTQLIWQRCSVGQRWNRTNCLGMAVGYTWANAQDIASTINPRPSVKGNKNLGDNDDSRDGKSTNDSSTLLIAAATSVVSPLTVAWRLPTHKELFSLVEQACRNPSINMEWFPATRSSFYWSASPLFDDANFAWGVDFNDGRGSYDIKDSSYRVRLVRSDH